MPFVAALWHRMPNPQQAQRTRKSTVATILKKHQIRRFDAQEVLTQLRTDPLPVPAATAAVAEQHLTLLWQQLTLVGHQVQELERHLIETLESLKTVRIAVPCTRSRLLSHESSVSARSLTKTLQRVYLPVLDTFHPRLVIFA